MTVRSLALSAIFVLTVSGCGMLAADRGEEAFDPSRILMTEEDERPGAMIGHEERMKLVRKRFPGADRIDLVRIEAWPEKRVGACWSDMLPMRDVAVDSNYATSGLLWTTDERSATSIADLHEQGWKGVYRSPVGAGIERRASFERADFTVETAFVCKCEGRGGVTSQDELGARLRFRWQGKGHVPEVSGATMKNDKKRGLRVGFSSGNLVRYEIPVHGRFPEGHNGICGGTLALTLLVDPPIL